MKYFEIRRSFLDYFSKNGHKTMPSSGLITENDPSLLFTNSGMVQFKDWFLNLRTSDYKNVTTAQKCLRAGGKHNDLENVGYTKRHHTFFEMLGNFSFGGYFKEQAIFYAWDLLTNVLKLDKNKLYVTIYHDDDQAFDLWKKIAMLSDDRIIRIDTTDNFWSMGETGPCGPCSEIFYDHGEDIYGGLPGTKDQDGDRFVEIWNIVFMQYNQVLNKPLMPLLQKNIDTGAGLERLSAVLQGVSSNYDTDIFLKLINTVSEVSGVDYLKNENGGSHRVIADHIRAICFMIADGIMPSNEGRGYVLRRIIRRAARHVHLLGCKDAILAKIVPSVVESMGGHYNELVRAQSFMVNLLQNEENKFLNTLSHGLEILEKEVASISEGGVLSGKMAFKLYDTYGFPIGLNR